MKKLDISIGNEINRAIAEAISESKNCGEECQFDFNGVTVRVVGHSDPKLIYRDWDRGMQGFLGDKPTVGPTPCQVLSAAEISSDAVIRDANENRQRERHTKWQQEAQERKDRLSNELLVCGAMEFSDEPGWQEAVSANQDAYGAGVVRFAEKWARLMQKQIEGGQTVPGCAEAMCRLADDEGITGFMYGCAVSILSKCWKHGEELRRWHNKETQIGDEGDKANESGGVLNPAVLNVSE